MSEFVKGYCCAVATLLKIEGDSIRAKELMACIGRPTKSQVCDEDWPILVENGYVGKKQEGGGK